MEEITVGQVCAAMNEILVPAPEVDNRTTQQNA
jgi:hypothetical protein